MTNMEMFCGVNKSEWLKPRLRLTFWVLFVTFNNDKNILFGAGARKGLIGKTGEKPARSRHCNGEQIQEMPLGRMPWEGLEERRTRARRTACLTIAARPTKDREGDLNRVLFIFNPGHSDRDFCFLKTLRKKERQ